jgi:hypothetical protein
MTLRDFIPPAAARMAASVRKAFSGGVASFLRGDDLPGSARSRLVEPYAQSAWIRAAVAHVANPISSRPLKFYAGDSEFDDSRLAAWWARPALGPKVAGRQTRLSLEQVLFDLAAWERLEGEFFLVLGDEWLVTAGRSPASGAALPPFLIPNPQRMSAIVHGDTLDGWRLSLPGGRQVNLVPEQVIHERAFNPFDDWRGVGCEQAARIAAEGAFLTGVYIRDLAKNNGDQGMVVIAKNGKLETPQREQITADLRAKRAALARGEVKDLLLGGADISVERPQEQAASAELMGSKAMSHEEVFVAFGVPPSLAAVKQSYSVGKESDKYQLITDTCQPVGARVAAGLARAATLQAGRELTAELEWDDHPVMIEVRNSRIDSLQKLWGMGMPVRDANDFLGLGMKPFSGWETGYLPFSVAPVDSAGVAAAEPTADPALAEPKTRGEEDPAVAHLRLLVLARQRAAVRRAPECATVEKEFAAFACACHGTAGVAMKERDPKEVAQWRTLMSQRRATLKSFQSALGRVLMTARVEVLRRLEGYQPKAIATKAAAADFLFDLAKFADSFTSAMRNQHRSAIDTAGAQLFKEVGKDDPFAAPAQAVRDFLAARENKLKDAPAEIFDRVKAALSAGLEAGDTHAELAGRVKAAFNEIADGRARTIALTETGAVYGAGRDLAMREAGVQFKRWLTSGNATVRAAHAEANGQTVPVDEPFVVDGEQLMFPGDSAGSPGNVVNCHCVSIATATAE